MKLNRKDFKKILKPYVGKVKDLNKIEKTVYTISKDDTDVYKKLMYEVFGELLNKKDISDIITQLENNNVGWSNPIFRDSKILWDEQNEFIENPFEIEEGVLECKCGSKKVFSYSRQTRGADEPMTTFAECIVCSHRWKYSG